MARSESIDDPPSPGRNPVITKQDILSELNEAGIPLTITQLHERENIDASRRTVHSRVSDLLAAEEVEEVPYGNATAYRPTNSQVPIPDGGIVISKLPNGNYSGDILGAQFRDKTKRIILVNIGLMLLLFSLAVAMFGVWTVTGSPSHLAVSLVSLTGFTVGVIGEYMLLKRDSPR